MTPVRNLAIGEDEFLVYDCENYRSWIQSAEAVALVDRR